MSTMYTLTGTVLNPDIDIKGLMSDEMYVRYRTRVGKFLHVNQ